MVREYLTMEELQQLANTPTKCRVREPFLFSCFTGLRWSDVTALRWGDVEQFGGRTRIRFRQKKTGEQEYMDINAQAVALMGECKDTQKKSTAIWRYFVGLLLVKTLLYRQVVTRHNHPDYSPP